MDLVDLNGDGIPEALARIESLYSCGSHGCPAYVLDLSGPTARRIGDFIAFSLKVLPTKIGAWRDVSLNGTKQVFQAGKYVSVAKAPVSESVAKTPTAAAPVVEDRAEQAEGLSKQICGRVLFYPSALLIRDNGNDIFIEDPKYDPKSHTILFGY